MTKARKMGVRTPDIVQDELKKLHDTYGSWRIVQAKKHPKVPFGTLSTIAKHGVVPKRWYAYFGLQLYKEAPVCPKCGEVHVSRRCTNIRTRRYGDLWDWPVEELRRALEHREEM
jgi:hypothetical protein